ncbi:MAG: ThiF family adenylyltransferase, partial [Flavobacteriales bacterium]|nr:ThiF family adenylyltransferase [Flavobacteriales bacterium]
IGLSVGQSVSLALALERVAGEIRIADMDVLELSNLNRIRSAAANVGLKKTVMVAREIAEIDPFLSVVCFDSGIDRENVDAFLTGDGGIDLLVEECDDVAVKILVRQRCRALGIPVLMDTSDRGMIDIERYDLDRNYKLLHGKISEDISYEFLRSLETSEDKLPYITPFSGVETLSTRMKASALEVGQTITTWPQLASDVILGGAVVCNLARRVLLGEDVKSQRQWIDVNSLLTSSQESAHDGGDYEARLTLDQIDSLLTDFIPELRSNSIDKNLISSWVEAACKAPSAGNMQRWKWVVQGEEVIVLLDKMSDSTIGDNGGIHSLLSIGCALENLR